MLETIVIQFKHWSQLTLKKSKHFKTIGQRSLIDKNTVLTDKKKLCFNETMN